MNYKILPLCLGVLFLANGALGQQASANPQIVPVHLQVETGTPLRLYITKRVSYRVGETVPAKVVEPVWAYDRVVIPAGATVEGQVVKLDAAPKMIRARAILGGDFTPLKRAEVSFVSLTLPGVRSVRLQTQDSFGLPTMYMPPRPAKKTKKQTGAPAKSSRARQFLQQQAQNQANARSHGFLDFIRGPNKREWLESFFLSKLPYHPQWYRTRTRFDTVLTGPLDFGTVEVASADLAKPGTPPPPDSLAQMRLVDTISSSDANVGDPMQGVLSQPLFTPEHKLLLPEGTRFSGRITLAQPARMWHRGGKLRFSIEQVDVPETESVAASNNATERTLKTERTQAQMVAVDADPNAVKVDSEGTARATESKTRLLRPAIAALVAAKSMDNDEGKQTASGGADSNAGGRSLGGFSGFGLLGTAAARGPRPIGAALGFYGLAWSVYSNVISRGREVTFEKNTAIAIQFGTPRKK